MKLPLPFDRRLACFEFRPHVGNAREIINLMSFSGVEVLVASGMHQEGWAANPKKDATDSPALVWHRYGKGEAIYLTPEAGREFLQWPHPELRKLLESLVNRGKPWIPLRAPKRVEMTAFLHPQGALAIHLVNLPWCTNRPPVPYGIPVLDEVAPVHNVELRTRNIKSRNVSLPLSREKVRIKKKGSDLLVTVPVSKYHQVIWSESGEK